MEFIDFYVESLHGSLNWREDPKVLASPDEFQLIGPSDWVNKIYETYKERYGDVIIMTEIEPNLFNFKLKENA